MTMMTDSRAGDQTSFDTLRHTMASNQLRTNAVNDQRVIAAMATVPREAYVPQGVRALAYRDTAIPAGNGRRINLPLATGRLLTEAYLRSDDRVLLIGAAGGYTAALLAGLVADVVAVESDVALAALARESLAGFANVALVEGPLEAGHAAGAPYDVLIIDGAVETIPDALVAQVKTGGRAVAGLAERGVTRLAAGRKTDGGFGMTAFVDVECVALPGFDRPTPFRF